MRVGYYYLDNSKENLILSGAIWIARIYDEPSHTEWPIYAATLEFTTDCPGMVVLSRLSCDDNSGSGLPWGITSAKTETVPRPGTPWDTAVPTDTAAPTTVR